MRAPEDITDYEQERHETYVQPDVYYKPCLMSPNYDQHNIDFFKPQHEQ